MSERRFVDFGRGHWFGPLEASRRFFWDVADLPRLAELLELGPGLRIADFGCGWGYLGHLLLPLIDPGGRIDGFDLDEELIARARERCVEAGLRGRVVFHSGDITCLDEVADDRYDLAICQTVLMHLSRPEEALSEMLRVVRPGGLVVAIEPDLLGSAASQRDNIEADDFEHLRDRLAVHSYIAQGALLLGAGDYRIAGRLPQLMEAVGLEAPQLWFNPVGRQCLASGAGLDQNYASFLLASLEESAPQSPLEEQQPLFAAAGGSAGLWSRFLRRERQLDRERMNALREGRYQSAMSPQLGVCTGRVSS